MKRIIVVILLLAAFVAAVSCGPGRRVSNLTRTAPEVTISLPNERDIAEDIPDSLFSLPSQDTLIVYDFQGRKVTLMNAVRDDATGEMVAVDELQAAVVTARFRNVAERHGKVDLEFQIRVPRIMLEQDWQTRFYPDMYMLGDSTRLEMLILTGAEYRKAQLKGYQRYNNFIASIVSDTTRFINLGLLEAFLQRNIPQVYAFKSDSTEVSEETFESCFGVTDKQAIEHYTDKIARYINNRKKGRIDAMYRKYVKAPIVTEGVRLDTVFVDVNGDFVYNYVQTIKTQPKLRKVDIVLSGEVFQQDLLLYNVPRCSPLTFYISSLSSFTDNRERYLTRVVERRAEANTACHIEFAVGKSDIDESLGFNAGEIGRIRGNFFDILMNEKYDLDSVAIRSFASPEGTVAANNALSERRAASAGRYFKDYISRMQDSLRRAAGYTVTVGDGNERMASNYQAQDIRIVSSSGGENWDMLDYLVATDTSLTDAQKARYKSLSDVTNPDERERRMQGEDFYRYLRSEAYPRLRTVHFDFYLHRKGMVKDTVHTTELDSVYMRGVQAIRDRDYNTACALLGSYGDWNTAVAYLSADRNMSALQILEPMERTAAVNYLLAVLYARLGDEQKAVQCYIHSCSQDHSYVNRGNLDPEVSALIKKYGLNRQDDIDYSY